MAKQRNQIADDREFISGESLLQLAADTTQVIDGQFAGYRLNESAIDVETFDDKILGQGRRFRKAKKPGFCDRFCIRQEIWKKKPGFYLLNDFSHHFF